MPDPGSDPAADDSATSALRREEILDIASKWFASSGLRTSLREIADASGIKTGSLYHHFESKDAIVVALMQRFHDDFDRLAAIATAELKGMNPQLVPKQIVRLGTAIAALAVRHSAAVQLTFYEPPAGASYELVTLSGRVPTGMVSAMLATLRVGRSSGFIRSDIDLAMVADRICQSMLLSGLVLFHFDTAVNRVAEIKCDIIMRGIATEPPSDAQLDRSEAFEAVERALHVPGREEETTNEKYAVIRRVATAEFGRRGYDLTTLRDIAAAAGVSTGSVYRAIGSKEELLATLMNSFSDKIIAGWNAALGSDSTVLEKLDAVAWLNINVMEQFHDEFRIQLAWLRQSPPEATNVGWSFPAVLQRLQGLLNEGAERGEIRIANPSEDLTAGCVLELMWIPERILQSKGKRAALIHARDTLLRGVANR